MYFGGILDLSVMLLWPWILELLLLGKSILVKFPGYWCCCCGHALWSYWLWWCGPAFRASVTARAIDLEALEGILDLLVL